MTYNVFSGTLNPAQSNPIHRQCGRMLCAAEVSGGRQEEAGGSRRRPWEEGQGRGQRSGVTRCSDWDSAGQDTGAAATGRWTQGNDTLSHFVALPYNELSWERKGSVFI